MRMRTTASLAALLLAAVAAAPAQAKLVYVKQADTAQPVVYVATDKGKQQKRLGTGRAPAISPDGRWVAFVTVPAGGSRRDTVVLTKLEAGAQRFVMQAEAITSLRFSPDSRRIAAVADGRRIRVYDIAKGKRRVAAAGDIRGYSFAPDSKRIVFGEAAGEDPQANSDLYVVRAMAGDDPDRLTTSRDALNPVWGPQEVFFDRFEKREDDAPAYNLFAVDPATKDVRRLTDLTIPPLVSGLVPLEVAADSRRMLSVFTGTDTQVGFTVNARTGDTRALSTDFERGIVGFDLSADGKTILGHTGGPDPANAHDVITLPYGGGEETVLVEGAAFPDWTR